MPVSILVADDSPIARKAPISALPTDRNARLTRDGKGAEELSAYRSGKPDAMPPGLTMPKTDGYEIPKLHGAVGRVAARGRSSIRLSRVSSFACGSRCHER